MTFNLNLQKKHFKILLWFKSFKLNPFATYDLAKENFSPTTSRLIHLCALLPTYTQTLAFKVEHFIISYDSAALV